MYNRITRRRARSTRPYFPLLRHPRSNPRVSALDGGLLKLSGWSTFRFTGTSAYQDEEFFPNQYRNVGAVMLPLNFLYSQAGNEDPWVPNQFQGIDWSNFEPGINDWGRVGPAVQEPIRDPNTGTASFVRPKYGDWQTSLGQWREYCVTGVHVKMKIYPQHPELTATYPGSVDPDVPPNTTLPSRFRVGLLADKNFDRTPPLNEPDPIDSGGVGVRWFQGPSGISGTQDRYAAGYNQTFASTSAEWSYWKQNTWRTIDAMNHRSPTVLSRYFSARKYWEQMDSEFQVDPIGGHLPINRLAAGGDPEVGPIPDFGVIRTLGQLVEPVKAYVNVAVDALPDYAGNYPTNLNPFMFDLKATWYVQVRHPFRALGLASYNK